MSTSGWRFSRDSKIPRAIRSPAADAMLPPRKAKSMTPITSGRPSMVPSPTRIASLSPVSSRAFFRRSA